MTNLWSDIHTPNLAEQRIQGSWKVVRIEILGSSVYLTCQTCKPFQSVLIQSLQLSEEEEQDSCPGLAMGLTGQREEVGNDFRAEREQLGLNGGPTVRPGLVKVESEHDPQTTGQALSFLFEQVWLGIPNKARLPQ